MPTGIALELEGHRAAKRQRPSPPDVMSGFLEKLQTLFLLVPLLPPLSEPILEVSFHCVRPVLTDLGVHLGAVWIVLKGTGGNENYRALLLQRSGLLDGIFGKASPALCRQWGEVTKARLG